VTLAGCAHLSAAERPDAFASIVGDFISGL